MSSSTDEDAAQPQASTVSTSVAVGKLAEDSEEEEEEEEEKESDTEYDKELPIDDGKRSDYKLIENLSIEIFALICLHLKPSDLLALYRASSIFSSKLRENSWIWRLVRQEVGLPDLKVPMISEFAYASLMYDNKCMICGFQADEESDIDDDSDDDSCDDSDNEDIALFIDFENRIRFCSDCGESAFVPLDELDDFSIISKELSDCLVPSKVYERKYSLTRSLPVVDRYNELVEAEIAVQSGSSSKATNNQLQKFLTEKSKLRKQLRQDEILLTKWNKKKLNEDKAVREAELERRRDWIEEQFKKEGWNSDFFWHYLWREEPIDVLASPPRLTRKAWKRIRPQLVELLVNIEEIKQAVDDRRCDRLGSLLDYFYDLGQDYRNNGLVFFVEEDDFLDIPIIDSFYWENNEDETLTLAMIDVHRAAITTAVDKFTQLTIPIYLQLLKVARKKAYNIQGYLEEPESSLDPDLTCYTDFDEIPEVFYYITSQASCKCGTRELASEFPMDHVCSAKHVIKNRISIDPRRIYALWQMLDLLDWQEDSSEEDFDELGKCFECTECTKGRKKYPTKFEWSTALVHVLNYHDAKEFPVPPLLRLVNK